MVVNRRRFGIVISGVLLALLLGLQAPLNASAAAWVVVPYLENSGTANVGAYTVTRDSSTGNVFEISAGYVVDNGSFTLLFSPAVSSVLLDISFNADFPDGYFETTTVTAYDANNNVVGTAEFASVDGPQYVLTMSAPAVKIVVEQVNSGGLAGGTLIYVSVEGGCQGPGNAYGNKNRVGCGAPGKNK